MEGYVGVFAAFAVTCQTVLLLYFAARRLYPTAAERHGWIAYAVGLAGVGVGGWLLIEGAPWQLYSGPFIFAVWAAFGWWVDLARGVQWREPIDWKFFGPYVMLYLVAQMFLWWPLWDRAQAMWVMYLFLFVANTTLNLIGHRRGGKTMAS